MRKPGRSDTVRDILEAPDRDALLDWLRQQRMAAEAQGWLLVHAGVVPQWDRAQTLALAAEVESLLRGPELGDFLHEMYGNEPDRWHEGLQGTARLRFIVNVLSRIRFCSAEGELEFKSKDGAGTAPTGFMPWFEVPGRLSAGQPIAFGHWSTLGLMQRDDLLALDTGCVWGGSLSAAALDAQGQVRDIIQVRCAQAQQPG